MDKKKKILALTAVVLIGGLAALNATGGIKNLKSDTIWIDTGDGNGYYADGGTYDPTTNTYSNIDPNTNTINTAPDPLQNLKWQTNAISNLTINSTNVKPANTNIEKIKELDKKINDINLIIQRLQADEKTEGSVKYHEKQISELQAQKIQFQRNVENASSALASANSLKDVKIDIYACTKNNAYKGLKGYDGKGYIYENPDIFARRVGDGTSSNPGELSIAIQDFTTKITIESDNLKKIPSNKTSEITKQKKIISDLQAKKKQAEDEKKAMQSSTVNTKCYQPAVLKSRNAATAITNAQNNLSTAQSALQTNGNVIEVSRANLKKAQDELEKAQKDLEEAEKQKREEEAKNNGTTKCDNNQNYIEGFGCAYICQGFPEEEEGGTAYASCGDITTNGNNTVYQQAPDNDCGGDVNLLNGCYFMTVDNSKFKEDAPKTCELNQSKPSVPHCDGNYYVNYILKGDSNQQCQWVEDRTCSESCASANKPKDFCAGPNQAVEWYFKSDGSTCEYEKRTTKCEGVTQLEEGTSISECKEHHDNNGTFDGVYCT